MVDFKQFNPALCTSVSKNIESLSNVDVPFAKASQNDLTNIRLKFLTQIACFGFFLVLYISLKCLIKWTKITVDKTIK